MPSLESALAEAEAGAGETDASLQRLDDALAELGATEQRWYEAEMRRIRAEILLQRDAINTAAEQSLQALPTPFEGAILTKSKKRTRETMGGHR